MKQVQVNNGRSKQAKLIILIDNIMVEIISSITKLIFYFFYFFSTKYNFLKKNSELKECCKNKKIFIIGLGPSINNYDLKKINDEVIIMVNRSFKHKDYEYLKPKFHLFVDDKMALGIWPLTYLDEIFKKNPDCKILLNANWYKLDKFANLRKHKQIYWIKSSYISLLYDNFSSDLTKIISTGGGVVEEAISLAVFFGSKDINILGVDGNGIALLMCNLDSHFDGKDPDYKKHNSLLYANDMILSSRGMRAWHRFSKVLKKRNINIYNLSKEGILDAYEYKDFNTL
tara:strand:+ start:563 stop:1420 length:858 start_codon:yes stop_codon:yes gene_type:complete